MRIYKSYTLRGVLIALVAISTVAGIYAQADRIPAATVDLNSPNRDVRYAAANTLCMAKDDPRAFEPLFSAINDSDHDVRGFAIRCMGFRKEKRAVPTLISILSETEGDRVEWAIGALAQIGDPAAIDPLITAMKAWKGQTKWHFVNALAAFDDVRVGKALFALEDAITYGETLAKAIGPAGVEYMAEVLVKGSPSERDRAAWVLSHIADERALNALLTALEQPGDAYLMSVMGALRHRIGVPAISPLLRMFEKATPETRDRIVGVLGHIDSELSVSALIYLIGQNKPSVRIDILKSLIGNPGDLVPWGSDGHFGAYRPQAISPEIWKGEIITVFIAAAKDTDPSVRSFAIRSLAMLSRDDVTRVVLDALTDPATATEASITLGLVGDSKGLSRVLDALKSQDYVLADRANTALIRIGAPAIDGLIQILQDKNKEFAARELVWRDQQKDRVLMCGNEPPVPPRDPRVRAAATLGVIGDERVRSALTLALKHNDDWIQAAAAAAIEQLDAKAKTKQTNK